MSSKKMVIEMPPKEKGLYRVVYVIDIGACSAFDAAKKTYQIMTDTDSIKPVLEVIDQQGKVVEIDLSKNN